jgi:hypothetical protein
MKFKNKKLIFLGIALFFIVSVELFLRSYYGFCHTVLFDQDATYEYLQKPNQDVLRFRKHNKYNSYSMRSEEVDTLAVKILGFGDSVLNGGILTDQDSLATSILSDTLSKLYKKKIQFLNISAGSWGPDNCYAYLKKQGNFGAKSIFLFVSSHDAYDNIDFKKVVDVHQSYPSKQFLFAIDELTERYIFPRMMNMLKSSSKREEDLLINKRKETSVFNPGFKSFLSYARSNAIPLTIYLHADKNELKNGAYNEQGIEIIKFANDNQITIIKDLENNLEILDLRDGIHLNSRGQRKIVNTILKSKKMF